jgi:mRNA-degrading endonuclease RelE of RelBE toxin-antitoxin system
MAWKVNLTRKALKAIEKLPLRERSILDALLKDLSLRGPVLPDWKNYSKLGVDTYHCHLSYKWVACWRLDRRELKLIEVYYAGSRENAPYG